MTNIPQPILYYLERVDHMTRLHLLAQLAFEMGIERITIEYPGADDEEINMEQDTLTISGKQFIITHVPTQTKVVCPLPNYHHMPTVSNIVFQDFTLDETKLKELKAKTKPSYP